MKRQRSRSIAKPCQHETVDNLTVTKSSKTADQFQILLDRLRGRFKGKGLLKALEVEKKKARTMK